MIKAIIYDMDGTIATSERIAREITEKFFGERGMNLTDEEKRIMFGLNWKDLVKLVLNNRGKEYDQRLKTTLKERYIRNMSKGVEPMPNIYPLLEMSKANFKIALGTNSRMREVDIIFNKLGFERYFDLKLARDHIKEPKPNPEIYLKAAKMLGVKPEECVVFEDSVVGVKAAKAAGMKCVAIVNTHTKNDLKEANILVGNYSEITLDILKGLGKDEKIISLNQDLTNIPKQTI
jgi:beta-phosphoglucomutase